MTREEAIVFIVQNPGREVLYKGNELIYFYDNGAIHYRHQSRENIAISQGMSEGEYEIVKQKVKKEIDVWMHPNWKKISEYNEGGIGRFCIYGKTAIHTIPAKLIVEVEE